ncbi:xylulokinase [Paenibacillus marinisediminis]
MSYVIGIDLGTSAVKAIAVNREGKVLGEASAPYPLYHERPGYSEQEPEDWVQGTYQAVRKLIEQNNLQPALVEGLSFSGQMHGLVLLDSQGEVLRRAILWNDTRTTAQCRQIEARLGDRLLDIAKNKALEGFTLPKLLWVKEHEPEIMERAAVFVLPKDYVRYRLTNELAMDYSDAAGTLLLDVNAREWSEEIAAGVGIPVSLCPPLVDSHAMTGCLVPDAAEAMGLHEGVRVFAGGADNACGAIGAGIVAPGAAMCSIGTSGVILAYEEDQAADYRGKVHYFNHGQEQAYYVMGVTLAAGYSLQWFKETFAQQLSFDELLEEIEQIPAGSQGLLFTPYLVGERTPHADANIRASFIGMDGSHTLKHAARAVMEGITFSLRESIELLRASGKSVQQIISIGGGAKNEAWLQMQADIFKADIVKLETEQGPAMGAAMLAAYGCGWFDSLQACSETFLKPAKRWTPNEETASRYDALFAVYQDVYEATRALNERLVPFR